MTCGRDNMSEAPKEYCDICDEATCNSGRGEDSLYIEIENNEIGPLCQKCFDLAYTQLALVDANKRAEKAEAQLAEANKKINGMKSQVFAAKMHMIDGVVNNLNTLMLFKDELNTNYSDIEGMESVNVFTGMMATSFALLLDHPDAENCIEMPVIKEGELYCTFNVTRANGKTMAELRDKAEAQLQEIARAWKTANDGMIFLSSDANPLTRVYDLIAAIKLEG